MREEIRNMRQKLEEDRIEHMRQWYDSEEFRQEYAAGEDLFKAYEEMKKTLDNHIGILLDQVEEELFLLKEAELQEVYMQGMSDAFDLIENKELYQSVS